MNISFVKIFKVLSLIFIHLMMIHCIADNEGRGSSEDNDELYPDDYTPLRIFYVDSIAGDDENDGESTKSAWKSVSKVNGFSIQTGDAIKFKCGGVYTGSLEVDWSGTSTEEKREI